MVNLDFVVFPRGCPATHPSLGSLLVKKTLISNVIWSSSSLSFSAFSWSGGIAEEYRKNMMKDEPLPEPIKDLLNNPFRTGQERFVKDFNTKSIVIIYHNPNDFLKPVVVVVVKDKSDGKN
ncbi:Uncharacterized protein Rs2_44615 [Raphanus sativus]|nr:Uncharacterized protein Rs2_44615 [Raphanus sativus]